MMWWGGHAEKNSKEAKAYSYTPTHDLHKLYAKDAKASRTKFQDALEPFHIDEGSFETITELLETAETLNSDLKECEKRPSDKALARIAIDLTAPRYVPSHWTPSDSVWRKLCGHQPIGELKADLIRQLADGKYEQPSVPEFNPKEPHADLAAFKHHDGWFTAEGLNTFVDDSNSKYRKTPDELEAEILAESGAGSAGKEAKLQALV
ncbi:unnamed protein product [Phytophthora fragariaefolia]|uniref:Unnamed protein product n=1 Tax=Phytophthora fragariaefolia TaxID=1490495 RepID=A0A9W6YP20_9STRA|nr:unnamed protein product [Phytophthora fragariaefolia]